MTTINLREFYPWYKHDEFVIVTDEIAAEVLAGKRDNKTHERIKRRYKVYSLDIGEVAREVAKLHSNYNTELLSETKMKYCNLCQALNSLPEAQGKRIDAHYLLGMSQVEIANSEEITLAAVNHAIIRGLAAMKEFLTKSISSRIQ